ncbi:hypothetical protein IWQ60_009578 [Tieghemiomyces parasiticus]|uniref:Serine/threonine-protein kinase RAD53 n=1 Tax=Tieghemiomyces parasiticus TaxID=78921 RepID=A0A9W7ZMK6_9FUNG|nr:hypothetical protein IWQ60_009578 [Tieghemiomyces parasiticus]
MEEATQPTQEAPASGMAGSLGDDYDRCDSAYPRRPALALPRSHQLVARLVPLRPELPGVGLLLGKLSRGYVIGRAPVCDIHLRDTLVSQQHCRIFTDATDVNAVDLTQPLSVFVQDTSRNGTYVNGVRLGKNNQTLLMHGDTLRMTGPINLGQLAAPPPASPRDSDYIYHCMTPNGDDSPQALADFQCPELFRQYDIKHVVGSGNFSVVRLSIEKATGRRYACKVIRKRRFSLQPKVLQSFTREVEILKRLTHGNIIAYHGVFEDDQYLCILTEFVVGGDLLSYVAARGHLTEDQARRIFFQLLSSIRYLHEQGISHRDLKPENIMLAGNGSWVKLTDFGLARYLSEATFVATMCGTPNYLAPEVIGASDGHVRYTKLVDMWSLGVILFHMLTGVLPFEGETQPQLYAAIQRGLTATHRPEFATLSPGASNLITHLLQLQPERRLPVAEAQRHAWVLDADGSPPRSAPAWGRLTAVPGSKVRLSATLRGTVATIGRVPTARVYVEDQRVSKCHCSLLHNGETVLLQDLSSNGMFVNGTRVDPTALVILRSGDVIDLIWPDNSERGALVTPPADCTSFARANSRSRTGSKRPPREDSPEFKTPPPLYTRITRVDTATTLSRSPPSPSIGMELESLVSGYPSIRLSAGADDTVTLGRGPDCHSASRYTDSTVSSRHCDLTLDLPPGPLPGVTTAVGHFSGDKAHSGSLPLRERPTAWVRDTSNNGTFLNSHRLPRGEWHPLHDGDWLVLAVSTDWREVTGSRLAKRARSSSGEDGLATTVVDLSARAMPLEVINIGYRVRLNP